MFAACTYEEIEDIEREVENKEIVVLLFARPNEKTILEEFEYIHYNSAKYCSIYAIGYTDDSSKATSSSFRRVDCYMKNDWYYSAEAFVDFKEKLQNRIKWEYSGEAEILILQNNPRGKNPLTFTNYVAITVNKGIRDGYIDSFQKFMESLIRSSKKNIIAKGSKSDNRNYRLSIKNVLVDAITDCKRTPDSVNAIIQDRLFYRTAIHKEVASMCNSISENDTIQKKDNSPKLFISYSQDDDDHKKWVLKLATDLRCLGVDATLDQWDLRIGADLSLFMEKGLSDASLVLCVCSEQYVKKANAGIRGAGYEKMIMVQPMLNDTNIDYIIPIVRNNTSDNKTPRFLGAKLYIDFTDDSLYLYKLSELVCRIFNKDISKKPPLGKSPFSDERTMEINLKNAIEKSQYHSPEMTGTVSFNYTNNSGDYTIGTGEFKFVTHWSTCGFNSIYAYNDRTKAIGYIPGYHSFPKIDEIKSFDFTSRTRVVYVDEVVVWMNEYGRFAATKITNVCRESQGVIANLSFEYVIYS